MNVADCGAQYSFIFARENKKPAMNMISRVHYNIICTTDKEPNEEGACLSDITFIHRILCTVELSVRFFAQSMVISASTVNVSEVMIDAPLGRRTLPMVDGDP